MDRPDSLEPVEASPCREQRLLEQVLRVVGRADDPITVQLQLTSVWIRQLAEGGLVAGARPRDGLLGHARILASVLLLAGITDKDVAGPRN
jgi:hypothetical protein